MSDTYDIAIIGAGPAGLCFAKSLSKLGLSIVMVERQARGSLENPAVDGRDIALTHFSKDALTELGMWPLIPADAISEIREARVYNGDSSNYMGLSSSQEDQLAFIISNHLIRKAAFEAVKDDKNITLLDNTNVEGIELKEFSANITITGGRVISSKLLVAADSRFSDARKKVGISASMKDFGKVMVVCQMAHELPHNGVANECFHIGHTLAVLPLVGNRSSVIITVKPDDAAKIMKMSEAEISEWVEGNFQHKLGKMSLDSERHTYPLVAVYADKFIANRFALAGDAAVGMHPITAHGFNFGLKGAHTLAGLIGAAIRTGGDIGTTTLLNEYQHRHRIATKPLYLMTGGIVKLYTNDSPSAQIARKILLKTANRMTPIKSMIEEKLAEKETSHNLPSPVSAIKRIFKLAA